MHSVQHKPLVFMKRICATVGQKEEIVTDFRVGRCIAIFGAIDWQLRVGEQCRHIAHGVVLRPS